MPAWATGTIDIERDEGEEGASYVLTLSVPSNAYGTVGEVVTVETWPGRKPAPHVVPTEQEIEAARMALGEWSDGD